ncbi:CvpA family protein [Wolbachia endosymbiont of Cruorifilaria tuberocauda]|uniref:CvpA family protein n=1 Tax=Wolbachia endosymbiont of Cruorifilaria tuberocauda TaxID=1812111 RepID=UPI00158AAC8E|nr:CvpA family protein [Wolbachia endosymbiont of Cruorifilaria tuberocauda]QKX01574.1 CvpA family protein [Wolbachia endosymbiont of Cruorifilaria tuberocauda]
MLFDCIIIFIIVICAIISVTRGFIKELFALMFLCSSVFLTVNHYDFFTINYSKYFDSEATQNIFSTISVFVVLNFIFMLMNNWLMYILSPIRLGLVDRVTGVCIGILKGILLSHMLFLILYLYCYVAHDKKEELSKIEEILPDWITGSHSYQVLFVTIENIVNIYVPESLILKIKEVGEEMIDQEKPCCNKNKKGK